jgi:quercetin dioxygenase-like cupin family protein
MNNLNPDNRSKVLGRSAAFSRGLRAAKRIAASFTGRQLALAAIVAAVSSVAVAAVLTPSSGILPLPGSGVVARASFADQTDIKFKVKREGQEVTNVNNAGDTVMQQIIIAPGGYTGWHSHPGPVVVLIKSGQMSFYDGDDPTCTVRTYSAGQAFIDSGQGHVHIARNEGTENLELWATYFDVPPGGAFRIDAPNPGNCSF